MRVAIANQKGGVGKTTTAVNLAAGLAGLGHRILLVDLDPQSNATTGVGVDHRLLDRSVYDVLIDGRAAEDVIVSTEYPNLELLPSAIDLAGAELELVPAFARESKLRAALEPIVRVYDVIFVDCPPSLGLLTVNALTAADWMLVPIQCEYYALEGLTQLLRNVDLVRAGLNPRLDVGGILLTMYDARTKLSEQVAEEVRKHFADRVFDTVIPRSVRLSEAPSYGQPAVTYDPSSRGSMAYRWLAEEFSARHLRASSSADHVPTPPTDGGEGNEPTVQVPERSEPVEPFRASEPVPEPPPGREDPPSTGSSSPEDARPDGEEPEPGDDASVPPGVDDEDRQEGTSTDREPTWASAPEPTAYDVEPAPSPGDGAGWEREENVDPVEHGEGGA